MILDRYGHFFRTRGRNNAAVAGRYLRGLAQAENCTFESMAAVVEGGCAQQFQHFISESPWDHEPVLAQISRDADALLGGKPLSALIIDESSFPKQGDRSVGVARQWTGRLGKVDNCQVAVFGVLTDGERHAPIDVRLFLPNRWIEDPERCARAGIAFKLKLKDVMSVDATPWQVRTRQLSAARGTLGRDMIDRHVRHDRLAAPEALHARSLARRLRLWGFVALRATTGLAGGGAGRHVGRRGWMFETIEGLALIRTVALTLVGHKVP